MWVLRRILMQMGTVDAMEFLLDKMKDSKTNEAFRGLLRASMNPRGRVAAAVGKLEDVARTASWRRECRFAGNVRR
jgi:hypothetical protein